MPEDLRNYAGFVSSISVIFDERTWNSLVVIVIGMTSD
jgi:hypothetical protein